MYYNKKLWEEKIEGRVQRNSQCNMMGTGFEFYGETIFVV